jgi:hypothetical protein
MKKRSRKKKKKSGNGPVLIGAVILIAFTILGYWKSIKNAEIAHKTVINFEDQTKKNQESTAKPIGWKDLEGLDVDTGRITPELKALDSQIVKLPGFMVPLTDNLESFREFLIVPDAQACIHMPPPPPNQILYVSAKKDIPIGLTLYPFWFQGKLELMPTNSKYGRVSYTLTLQRLSYFQTDN